MSERFIVWGPVWLLAAANVIVIVWFAKIALAT